MFLADMFNEPALTSNNQVLELLDSWQQGLGNNKITKQWTYFLFKWHLIHLIKLLMVRKLNICTILCTRIPFEWQSISWFFMQDTILILVSFQVVILFIYPICDATHFNNIKQVVDSWIISTLHYHWAINNKKWPHISYTRYTNKHNKLMT